MLAEEGARQRLRPATHRLAGGRAARRRGVGGLSLCAKRPELYSDTVSAILVPEGARQRRAGETTPSRPITSPTAWAWAR